MRLPFISLLLAASAVAAPPPPKTKPPFKSPKEMVEMMEKSPRMYEIGSEPNPYPQWSQQNAMLAWPEGRAPIPVPAYRKNANGSRSVVPLGRPEEIDQMLEKVEPLFEAKDWEGADQGYASILKKFPDDYSIQLNWGDAALFAGKAAIALERYEKATKLNPADHRAWYYRGNALAGLGRKKEAIDAWSRALAMSPANSNMLVGLEPKAAALGYTVNRRSFLPAARVTAIKDGFKISLSKQPHWLAWGICKAMWRGEAAHRKEMTGSEADSFSVLEEKECLGQLANFYEQRKKDEPSDPIVDQLLAALKAELISGYLIYEIASRVDPHAYLIQSPEVQAQVEGYVKRFVLVPAP